jgi:hypothetical protein
MRMCTYAYLYRYVFLYAYVYVCVSVYVYMCREEKSQQQEQSEKKDCASERALMSAMDPLDALRPLMEAFSPSLHALIVPSEDAHQVRQLLSRLTPATHAQKGQRLSRQLNAGL